MQLVWDAGAVVGITQKSRKGEDPDAETRGDDSAGISKRWNDVPNGEQIMSA